MQTPTSPLDQQQRTHLFQIVEELRGLIEASVSLNADTATLADLAETLAGVRQQMQALAGNRGLEHFNPQPGDDLNAALPTSPVTGRFNPLAPPVEMSMDGEKLIGRVTCGRAYEGPPNSVHGAVVSAIYDQLLAFANVFAGCGGPTAKLEVEFLRPTPLEQPLEFHAWIERRDGRKITTLGECYAGGELVTRCNGLFIQFMG